MPLQVSRRILQAIVCFVSVSITLRAYEGFRADNRRWTLVCCERLWHYVGSLTLVVL